MSEHELVCIDCGADPARIRTALTLLRLVEGGWRFFPQEGTDADGNEKRWWSAINPTPDTSADRSGITLTEAIEAAERDGRES